MQWYLDFFSDTTSTDHCSRCIAVNFALAPLTFTSRISLPPISPITRYRRSVYIMIWQSLNICTMRTVDYLQCFQHSTNIFNNLRWRCQSRFWFPDTLESTRNPPRARRTKYIFSPNNFLRLLEQSGSRNNENSRSVICLYWDYYLKERTKGYYLPGIRNKMSHIAVH